jgi:hypothetical protein
MVKIRKNFFGIAQCEQKPILDIFPVQKNEIRNEAKRECQNDKT